MIDYITIIRRLEEAGETLLNLSLIDVQKYITKHPEIPIARDARAWFGMRTSFSTVSPERFTSMNEALQWILLIPEQHYILRRIVGARLLICPFTIRHLHSFKSLGERYNVDTRTIQRWHRKGITMIEEKFNAKTQ